MKKKNFYRYIVAYTLVRICINLTYSMIPYYLENVLDVPKAKKGGTPIMLSIIYILSTAGCLLNSTCLQKHLDKYNSRPLLMFVALIFISLGFFPIIFIHHDAISLLYILSIIFGIGFGMALNTASNLINDVVGSKGEYGAFVYGAYSFADKLICGILLYIFVDCVKDDKKLLKYIIPVLPVICILLALVIIIDYRKFEGESEYDESASILDDSRISYISIDRKY